MRLGPTVSFPAYIRAFLYLAEIKNLTRETYALDHLVHALEEAEVALAVEVVVVLRQPVGEREGVVHEGGVEEGEEGGGRAQGEPWLGREKHGDM